MRGGASDRYLMALPIRFWSSCSIDVRFARTIGSGSLVTIACVSAMLTASESITDRSARPQSTGVTSVAPPTRENTSRSSMSRFIRFADPTIRSTYIAMSGSPSPGIRSTSSPEKLMILRSGSCRSCDAT